MSLKIVVDRDLCEGNARCVELAPAAFALDDDDDTVRVLVEEPGEELRAAVEAAIARCPRQALSLQRR